MQTFVPHTSLELSAQVLDYRRLGKQRVETLQILNAMGAPAAGRKGWTSHPATKMWSANRGALITYGVAICDEWIARGYRDTCRDKILAHGKPSDDMPWWWGDERVHSSHRANLLRKDFEYYSKFGWTEDPEMAYFWPGPVEDAVKV